MNRGWTYVDQIRAEEAGLTALGFYVSRYPHSGVDTWRARFDRGEIRRTASEACESIAANDVLRAGDRLEWRRPPWQEPDAPCHFHVAHEDDHVLVLDKPAGLPVLPGGGFLERTLLHLARGRFGREVSPVHRIDRGTSGLVLFTRTPLARRALGVDQDAGHIEKIYRGRVEGCPERDAFEIDAPIRVPGEHDVPAHAHPDGRSARTGVIVRRRDPKTDTSLVDLTLHTGRPHQIRIHLAWFGHPLVGEPLYERGGTPRGVSASGHRPAMGAVGFRLHAMKLGFRHPASAQRTSVKSPPPGDLAL